MAMQDGDELQLEAVLEIDELQTFNVWITFPHHTPPDGLNFIISVALTAEQARNEAAEQLEELARRLRAGTIEPRRLPPLRRTKADRNI